MKEFCILIVLYKTKIEECLTLQSLFANTNQLEHSILTVWDNSPCAISTSEQSLLERSFPHVVYKHTPENYSLSKIYNIVYQEYLDYTYFVIFDQDSKFDSNYFEEVRSVSKQYSHIHLFVPLILHSSYIMSPGFYYHFKGKYRKEIMYGENSSLNMSVIASGMCIAMQYLKKVFPGFDERFDFYGVDTSFSIEYRKSNATFYLLKCDFWHSLSIMESESYEVKRRRLINHLKSLPVLASGSNWYIKILARVYTYFTLIKFKIKYLKARHEEIA